MLSVLRASYARIFHSRMTREVGLFFLIVGVAIYLVREIILLCIAAAALAYLLDPLCRRFMKFGCTRSLAATGSMLCFVITAVFLAILLNPVIRQQWSLLEDLLGKLQIYSYKYIQMIFPLYLKYVKENGWESYAQQISMPLLELGKPVLNLLWTTAQSGLSVTLYFLLWPIVSFFLLLDGPRLLKWIRDLFLEQNMLLLLILERSRHQFFAYWQGKCYEFLIVGISSSVLFALPGLKNAWWLGMLAGIGVFLPYIGTILATIPILFLAIHQWGLETPSFWITMSGYAAIQLADALLLVPLLFSRTLNLHPVVVFLATLIFGRWFGFWGLVFAIPLAALIHTTCQVWPSKEEGHIPHC